MEHLYLEVNSAAPDRRNIEEEGEDGGSEPTLHNERMESPERICTMLDQL